MLKNSRWSPIGYTLILLLALPAGAGQAQSAADGLASRISAVISTEEYRIASWGIAVADLTTGEIIYELNAEKLFVPGSVTKLFSGAAALATFGSEHRFVTPLHRRGEIRGEGILDGDLILRASGDPDLSGRINSRDGLDFTNRDHTYAATFAAQGSSAELTATDVLAGIDQLAAGVASTGIRQVRDILIDERLFERHESGGSPPFRVSPVVVNDHLIDITIVPGGSVGSPATIDLRPATSYMQFEANVRTVEPGQATLVSVTRVAPRRYTIRGQIAINRPPVVRPVVRVVEVDDPAEFARALLIERLQARGIRVEAGISSIPSPGNLPAEDDYAKLPIVARHISPPFAESLKVILKVSHNNHAHMLPLLIGAKNGSRSHAAGMRAVGEALRRLGVETSAFSLGDGEGGDQGDQISPRAVISLLRAMAAHPEARAFHDALPILGIDGTLADAIPPSSPARGKVSAKTGTYVWTDALNGRPLLRAKGLGGYVTANSGRRLAIAIFVNNVPMNSPADSNRHGTTLGKLAEIIQQSL